MNLEFTLLQLGEWTMLMLGESVLALLIIGDCRTLVLCCNHLTWNIVLAQSWQLHTVSEMDII